MNNIQHLRYAVEVERTGSISRAAENLYMGQPHLSKAIRELEEDMNITIFNRTTKGVAPTPQGERFLEYARNILAQIDELESLYKPSGARSFSISLPRASYAAAAFAKFAALLDDAEGLDLRYCETNPMQVIKDVSEGRSDMGIVRCQIIHEKYFLTAIHERSLKSERLWEFEYMALMSKRHPLAMAPEVTYSGLRHYTEIVHDDNSVPAMPVSEARLLAQTHEKKKKIAVYERGIQFELLRALPSSYIWVSPMPEATLALHGLVQKRCGDADNKYHDILIWRSNYTFTNEDDSFIKKLKAEIGEVAPA
ncbi:MAG: LysR family transcriptional regulator [Cloacibacillus sp.]